MMRGRDRRPESNSDNSNSSTRPLVWLIRLALFVAVIALCLLAALLLYGRWQDARLAALGPPGGGAHLGPVEARTFELEPDLTIPDLAAILSRAVDQQVDLTFIEGWRLEEMANYLEQVSPAAIDAQVFLAIVRRQEPFDLGSYDFLGSLPEEATLEAGGSRCGLPGEPDA